MFLDCVDEPGAKLFALAVHREGADAVAQSDGQVAALAGFKRASVLTQPPLELLARHTVPRYNTYVVWSTHLMRGRISW